MSDTPSPTLEISFYQITQGSLEKSVAKLLEKVYEAGMKSVLKVGSTESLDSYNKLLWTFSSFAFLPHSAKGDKFKANRQPLYLSTDIENPNKATVLATVDGTQLESDSEGMSNFKRCLDIFNGHDDDAVTKARSRWKYYKTKGYVLTYWKQDEKGRWAKQNI